MRVRGRSGRVAVALAVAVAIGGGAVGCGSTATIAHSHGIIEAEIVQSDSGGISVRQRSEELPQRVNRGDIQDIDHPGNVAMVIGACLLAGWGSFMTDRQFRDELIHGESGDVSRGARQLTLLFGVPGAIFLGLGSYHYISSVRAAWAFEHAEPGPPQAPPAGGAP